MRPLLLPLALLLAVSAAADDFSPGQKLGKAPDSAPGKAVAGQEAKANISDCRDGDEAKLNGAIQAAARRVDSCLEQENPAIARKIRSNFHKMKFHCGYSGGMAGGNTDANQDGSADVTLNFRAHGVQYSLAARTFHEMIHAVDPLNKLILSPHAHAQAGYPDVVYACQLDCYPSGVSDDERKQIMRLGRALQEEGRQVPLADVKDCPSEYDCPTISAYTAICRGGKVLSTKTVRDADKKQNAPICFAEALLNACSGACRGRKSGPVCAKACAFDAASDEGKGTMIPDFQAVGARLAAADDDGGKSLEGDDLALYKDGQRKKLFAGCR